MSQTLREWAEETRKNTPPIKVAEDHVPTENERNNVVYLSFKNLLGMGMRQVDLAVVEGMAPNVKDMKDLNERYCSTLGEYLWDHWMGEPEDISQEDVTFACQAVAGLLFSMDQEVREAL